MPFLFWMPLIVMFGMLSVAHDQAEALQVRVHKSPGH